MTRFTTQLRHSAAELHEARCWDPVGEFVTHGQEWGARDSSRQRGGGRRRQSVLWVPLPLGSLPCLHPSPGSPSSGWLCVAKGPGVNGRVAS